mmetsp:Transcript_68692/g.192593  ORF Transcript_68692/g.192593 Transcript_68692/m.192593 type:complete len:108 (+) Transcript_68692:1225-1548(+)
MPRVLKVLGVHLVQKLQYQYRNLLSPPKRTLQQLHNSINADLRMNEISTTTRYKASLFTSQPQQQHAKANGSRCLRPHKPETRDRTAKRETLQTAQSRSVKAKPSSS